MSDGNLQRRMDYSKVGLMTDKVITYLEYPANPVTYSVEKFLQSGYVGVGWNDLLTEMFEKLFQAGWDGRLLQLKQKFGTLRVYLYQSSDTLWDITNEYENRSSFVCEDCGGVPAEIRNIFGVLYTKCADCI